MSVYCYNSNTASDLSQGLQTQPNSFLMLLAKSCRQPEAGKSGMPKRQSTGFTCYNVQQQKHSSFSPWSNQLPSFFINSISLLQCYCHQYCASSPATLQQCNLASSSWFLASRSVPTQKRGVNAPRRLRPNSTKLHRSTPEGRANRRGPW